MSDTGSLSKNKNVLEAAFYSRGYKDKEIIYFLAFSRFWSPHSWTHNPFPPFSKYAMVSGTLFT